MSKSPSLGREWIEILIYLNVIYFDSGLPPWGGSGLKSVRFNPIKTCNKSPSLGREWIEIILVILSILVIVVSLLGEGVD